MDLKAKSASAKKLSEELAEHRKKLQKLYDEAKAKADKAVAAKAKTTVEEKKAQLATAAAALTAAGRALDTTASNLAAAGAGMTDLAQTYEAEKEKYLDKLFEYQEQERVDHVIQSQPSSVGFVQRDGAAGCPMKIILL